MITDKVIIVSSYESEEGFSDDAYGFYVEINDEVVAKYGDYYHDKGKDKCKGFIDGYYFDKHGVVGHNGNPKILYEERADYKKVYGGI